MKPKLKFMVLGILALILLSAIPSITLASPEEDKPEIEERQGAVFLITPKLKVRLSAGRPDILFWISNSTYKQRTVPVYHIGFHYVAELYGDDLVVDSRDEIDGKIYNLISDQITWNLEVENFTDELRATITSSQLANGAVISFVYHLYLEDQTVTKELNNSRVAYFAEALTQVKFDIIVSNWTFSPNATGLVFLVNVHELAFRHRIRRGSGINDPEEHYRVNNTQIDPTNRTADPKRHGIEFLNTRGEIEAFFSWTPVADVYDLNDNYIKSVNCTPTVASYGFDVKTFKGRKFGVEYTNLLLAYPNYGDNLKLVHDPTIGVNPESVLVSSSIIGAIALPIVAFAVIAIFRRKK